MLYLRINRLILIWMLIFSAFAYGQDTLVLASGRVWDVKNIEIDGTRIAYERHGKKSFIFKVEVFEFKSGGVWYKTGSNNTIETIAESSFKFKTPFFKKPTKSGFSPWAVGITGAYPFKLGGDMRGVFFSQNPTLRLEPEYTINRHLALKVPISFGFGLNNYSDETITTNYDQPTIYTGNTYLYGKGALYKYEHDHSKTPVFRNLRFTDPDDKEAAHQTELIFQIGAALKYYPFSTGTKNALFISNSFNYGIGNVNTQAVYATFDTAFYNNNFESDVPVWYLASETQVINKKYFSFFRYEFLIGMDMNFSRHVSFCFETGFSTHMDWIAKIPGDEIYLKRQDEPNYALAGGPTYEIPTSDLNLINGSPIFRFSLVFRFGQTKTFLE